MMTIMMATKMITMMTILKGGRLSNWYDDENYEDIQDDKNDDMDRWAVIKLAARASSAVVATSATEVEPSCERALSQSCCITTGSETKF